MDLSTNYMGMKLKNPVIAASSTLTASIEPLKRIDEAGAAAVVLRSLFEEQIIAEAEKMAQGNDMYSWYPDAVDFISSYTKEGNFQEYLDLIKRAKDTLNIPVIASINAVNPGEWLKFAKEMEKAGADGLELNISILTGSQKLSCAEIEESHFTIIDTVKKYVSIPVAVKLGRNYTNLLQFLIRLDHEGVDGLTMFNRFYRPDIDINTLKVVTGKMYSSPEEMNVSLRWVALLFGKVHCSIAASTGIHDASGVIKQLLAGASVVQLCSTLYKNGPQYVKVILEEMTEWMERNSFTSIGDFRGKVAKQDRSTGTFERLQYMKRSAGQME